MLHSYLDRAARRVPGRPAVRFRTEGLTYKELFRDASALAKTLAAGGITRGDRIAIWLPKGIEAIVCIHGVLIAGAAYVPIDPASPIARAAYLLRDCQAACLITTRDLWELVRPDVAGPGHLRMAVVIEDDLHNAKEIGGLPIVSWAAALMADTTAGPEPTADSRQLAYVLYTSGSSGAPKGVMLSHQNGEVVVRWACRRFRFRQDDLIASHAPLHFDLSIIDVFGAARAGATLVLVPDHQRAFGAALVQFVVAEGITVWYSVPGALVALLDAGNSELLGKAALRVVLYAGEVFPPKRLRDLLARLPAAEVHNLYGPTETNVCTSHQVRAQDVAHGAVSDVPIGRLCDFAVGHVVDDLGTPAKLAPGVRGELVIGGPSVMIGYWARSSPTESTDTRTAEFPALGQREHHTGDLVHVNVDGNLMFDGRKDDMVKIRGCRVEPAEVETAILASVDVTEACVVAVMGNDGGSRLEAYVVAVDGREIDLRAVQRMCSAKLPRYMIPSRISCIAELPRGSTGKIDRRALIARSHTSAGVVGGDGE